MNRTKKTETMTNAHRYLLSVTAIVILICCAVFNISELLTYQPNPEVLMHVPTEDIQAVSERMISDSRDFNLFMLISTLIPLGYMTKSSYIYGILLDLEHNDKLHQYKLGFKDK